MNKFSRFIFFVISSGVVIFLFINFKYLDKVEPEIRIIIITSLIMLSFTSLLIEHFFPSPTDVLANSISVLLILVPSFFRLNRLGIYYWIFFAICILAFLFAAFSILIFDKNKSPDSRNNKLSKSLLHISTSIGNGRFLYFSLFILSLIFFVELKETIFLILFSYATIILLIQPQKHFFNVLNIIKDKTRIIGELFAIHSKNVYLIKIYENQSIKEFDLVYINSIHKNNSLLLGIILEIYFLNNNRWAKAIVIKSLNKDQVKNIKIGKNEVALSTNYDVRDFIKGFVGTVIENSTIERLRFEFFQKEDIEEGQLLKVDISGNEVIYQVVQGFTKTEMLDSQDESGLMVGEALQIGIWNSGRQSFERFGWIPEINSVVRKISKLQNVKKMGNEFQLGVIPNTDIPVFINKEMAIGCHLAILGVTGTGKSVLTRFIVRELINDGTKVIYVDFTGECKTKLKDLSPQPIIPISREGDVFKAIDDLIKELAEFRNQRDQHVISNSENLIRKEFTNALSSFLKSSSYFLSYFELPDVSNTTGIFEYTRWFFKILFEIAKSKNNFGKKVCLVIEEAHTVVPEWNFIGESQKEAGALVNAICQIALQGRKYGVGLVVIAQRTANVSKTVLTQCNSIIAFQQFDNTSKEFLSNYLGADLTDALSTLKFRQAIAAGKGFRSSVPIIFQVPELIDK